MQFSQFRQLCIKFELPWAMINEPFEGEVKPNEEEIKKTWDSIIAECVHDYLTLEDFKNLMDFQ
eukprot:CAMPEP_0175137096 /NCGR_PEP_ID=MMETSP0087-20121206/9629_1 /TAXON_ID=136419 /ORGANISM="Unknown Unknown, Strain D1" /LENGTH=63 /DNA_ID=CAMNT_0016419901 /DNA_START=117 /DNA_END=308 /DNA_ORIENTATION=+